jgi:hypothetical protein
MRGLSIIQYNCGNVNGRTARPFLDSIDPETLGLPIELVRHERGEDHGTIPEIFAGTKIMWTIMRFEMSYPGRGDTLVKEFFPGRLLEWKVKWWESNSVEVRRDLLKSAQRKALKKKNVK